MKVDLHVHTHFSPDAYVPLNKHLIRVLKRRGVQGVAITDHNTFKGVLKAKRFLEKNRIQTILGEEVKTEYGELLCLFITEEIGPQGLKKYRSLEVIDQVKEQDGIVGLSHPFDFSRSNWIRKMQVDWIKKYIDVIEVYNARCNLNSMNRKAYNFCYVNHVPITAGSDAHFLMEIGRGCLLLEHADTVEDIRKQIMSNKVSVMRAGHFLPFINIPSFFFHAFTGLSRFFRPIRQYSQTKDVPHNINRFFLANKRIS
ncbi:MAG: PHP domain-containing protein [Promethearchaeota archaeon]